MPAGGHRLRLPPARPPVVPAAVAAAALAAVVGTAFDLAADPMGVAEGVWTYPDHRLSTPRFYDVSWRNFAGWLAIVFVSAMLPVTVGIG